MNIKIEKRVPFGFKGKWGKCYKNSIFDVAVNDSIIYQDDTYYDIGSDVQFKYLEDGVDKSVMNSQAVKNMVANGKFRLVKTTDAMFNNDTLEYECVVQQNDIVYVFGSYWICEKVDERSVFSPAKQTFYYLSLKNVQDEVLENMQNNNEEPSCILYFRGVSGRLVIGAFPEEDTLNVRVDWGDGTIEDLENVITSIAHTYESEGNYVVKVFSSYKYRLGFTNALIIKAEFLKNVTNCSFNNTSIMKVNFLSIEKLYSNAFPYNRYLKSIVLPEHINITTRAGSNQPFMFQECLALENVVINSYMPVIFARAFYGCTNLVSVTLPKTLVIFENNIFQGCDSLKYITLQNEIPPLNYTVIPQTIETIYIPAGTLDIYIGNMPEYADKFVEGE